MFLFIIEYFDGLSHGYDDNFIFCYYYRLSGDTVIFKDFWTMQYGNVVIFAKLFPRECILPLNQDI